jgi:hypothetical protein
MPNIDLVFSRTKREKPSRLDEAWECWAWLPNLPYHKQVAHYKTQQAI